MKKANWDDPYYHYKLPRRAIDIDVTASIPNFTVEIDGLSDVAADFKSRGFRQILDFGAGKLRNTLYLLRQGFKVWAVEFKEAFGTRASERSNAKARRFKNFFVLEYPGDFLKFRGVVDAVLLINVIHIVPEDRDRRRILEACTKRLRPGGLLLWMSVYGEPHYRPGVTTRLALNDGWCYNLHKRYQTFFREYKIPEILSLVGRHKLRQLRKITSNHHHAFLFEKP